MSKQLSDVEWRNRVISHRIQPCETNAEKVLAILSASRGGCVRVDIADRLAVGLSECETLLTQLVAQGQIVHHTAHLRGGYTFPLYTLPDDPPLIAWRAVPAGTTLSS